MLSEGDIRKAIIEDDLVESIIAMPPQLFYTTQIQVSLWFLNRAKKQQEDDGEPFEEKMTRLTGELSELFSQRHTLEAEIKKRLGAIGWGFAAITL